MISDSFKNIYGLAKTRPHYWGIPLAALGVLIQLISVLGVKPAIMQDEMIYAKFSRLAPMSEAPIPDYLFYWIFGATKYCGPNFYSCGKAINVVAFMALSGVIFLIAKHVGGKLPAWLASVTTLFSPVGSYASFFMPEMLFFLSIAVLSLFLLRTKEESKLWNWALLGTGLGIASLIKPHALFFGAVLAIYAIYLERQSSKFSLKRLIFRVGAAAICSIVAKFIIGFVFAGMNGLNLFGASYTSAITNIGPKSQDGVELQSPSLGESAALFVSQVWGHSLAASLLFSAAIVLSLLLIAGKGVEQSDRAAKDLAVLVLSSLTVGIFTIALFTAVITASGSDHSTRLMVRYYDYAVPFMYALISIAAVKTIKPSKSIFTRTLALGVITMGLVAVLTNLEPFKPAFYDGTSLVAGKTSIWINWLITSLAVILIAAFILNRKVLKLVSAISLLAVLSAGLSIVGQGTLAPLREPDRFDFAAQFVRGYLTEEEISAMTVVSHEDYALARALLLIDNSNVDYRVLLRGQTLGSKSLAEGKEWVLLMGDTFLDSSGCLRQQGNGYVLIKLCDSPEFYFNQTIPNQVVESSSGISKPENWGSWTIGNQAVITLTEALPKNAKVQFTLAVPKSIEDQTFTASVGGSSIDFNLSTEAIDGTFEFENDSPSREITFTIPNPKPQSGDGSSQDNRLVGIMLYKLKVLN